MPSYPDEFTEGLAALGRLGVDVDTLDERLRHIATEACRAIGPSDHAGMTVIRNGRPVTAGHTDDVIIPIDLAQYGSDSGPCVDAYRYATVCRVDCTETDDRWPEFSRAAAKVGVLSALSLPLQVGGEHVGALNLYSTRPKRFDDEHERLGAIFAEQAAVAIANTDMYTRVRMLTDQLQEALQTRDVIGQAKGILMAQRGVDADTAFDLLRRASQRRNVKLRHVAEDVTRTGRLVPG